MFGNVRMDYPALCHHVGEPLSFSLIHDILNLDVTDILFRNGLNLRVFVKSLCSVVNFVSTLTVFWTDHEHKFGND